MRSPLFRCSSSDALLLGLALAQAGLAGALWSLPAQPLFLLAGAVLAAGLLWWNANTISHNHIHNPLFRSRTVNHGFSLFLTLSTGVPQTLWKRRHLWHHAGEPAQPLPPLGRFGVCELILLSTLWLVLLRLAPLHFLLMYLPGYGLGMLLCQLQGHYEHAGLPVAVEPGISHYGSLYNLLWLNDGYHAEHHRYPTCHWSRLPSRRLTQPLPSVSAFPPLLRFLSGVQSVWNCWQGRALVWLEQLAIAEGPIQRFMLASHERALAVLLAEPLLASLHRSVLPPRIGIVGGGLFPRTALLLAKRLPYAQLIIIDENAEHIRCAKETLHQNGVGSERVCFVTARFCPQSHRDFELLVFPLGYVGDRDALYRVSAGEPLRLIHDWIFRRRGQAGVVISALLAKRLNLVGPDCASESESRRLAS